MWKEFKEFAVRGNAIDLAVGIVIGAAFNQVINSLVNDVLNPFLGLFIGHIDFGSIKVIIFGHALKFGVFLNSVFNFLIVAFAVFLVVKQINRFRRQEEATEKDCPFCLTKIPLQAVRCPACTSQLA
jgi:large conductance mechanosensitive channel